MIIDKNANKNGIYCVFKGKVLIYLGFGYKVAYSGNKEEKEKKRKSIDEVKNEFIRSLV